MAFYRLFIILLFYKLLYNLASQINKLLQNKKTYMSDNYSTVIGKYTLCFSQILGKGATGTVYKGYHNIDKNAVAIKVIQLSNIKDDATKSLLENEKSALKLVQNQNVIKLLDIVQTNQCCYIITQIYEGQTLKQYIAKKGLLSEEQAMAIFRKILNGCLHITQNCIIHRDLKPTNILLSRELQPTIIDFGFCEIITAKKVMRTFNVGSPTYMSPEAYLRTIYSQKSDSWSLGIILYEMLHGKTPDEKFAIKDYLQTIKNNPLYLSSIININLDKNVKEILSKSLSYNLQERMSISGMKYLSDVYNIKINKNKTYDNGKALNHKNNNNYGTCSIKNFHSIKEEKYSIGKDMLPIQRFQSQTLKSISNDSSSNEDKHAFMSFAEFSKTSQSFSNHNKKSSQINIVNMENKQSSISYVKGSQQQNQNKLMVNKFKTTNYYAPIANNYPNTSFNAHQSMNGFQIFSQKEIMQKKLGRPAFRQITVKYL